MSKEVTTPKKRGKDTKFYESSNRGDRIIRLPVDLAVYEGFLGNWPSFRSWLDGMLVQYPELFPDDLAEGYKQHGVRSSVKQSFSYYRIQSRSSKLVYSVLPGGLMPYMSAKSDEVWFQVLLMNIGVPPDVLVLKYGRDADYWYRLHQSCGRPSLVGTTIKKAELLPEHLAVDEKISFWRGSKVYACMVAAKGCILGMGLSPEEGEVGLQRAYGVFKSQILDISPSFSPKSVLCDGWAATQKAWRNLFSSTVIILCFLHAVLKIRGASKKDKETWDNLSRLAWTAYQQPDKEAFKLELLNLKKWAQENINNPTHLEQIVKACDKADRYSPAYDIPQALRTSNTVDRPMDRFDRFLFNRKYFHGHFNSAELACRAFALCFNFSPFRSRTIKDPKRKHLNSRAADLNGFAYAECWLQNLLISASLNGKKHRHQIH